MVDSFSIREAITFGWHTLKAHSALIYKVLLTMFAIQVAQSIVSKVLAGTIIGALASIVLAIAAVVVGAGGMFIVLTLAKGDLAEYADIIPPPRVILQYLGASIITSVVIAVPMLVMCGIFVAQLVASTGMTVTAALDALSNDQNGVLVASTFQNAPYLYVVAAVTVAISIYLIVRLLFVKLAVLDGAGITGSLRKSFEMTKGEKLHVLLFLLAIIGINILGVLALLVGLLVSIPVSMLAYARVYTLLAQR